MSCDGHENGLCTDPYLLVTLGMSLLSAQIDYTNWACVTTRRGVGYMSHGRMTTAQAAGTRRKARMQPLIHLHVLASGSKGNAALIEGPEGLVLVDMGISRKALLERSGELGVDASGIVAAVFTHEHSDHVSGASVFCKRFDGPLYATAGTIAARRYLTELPFTIVDARDRFFAAGMIIETFPTSHDVADPFGLRFSVVDEEGELQDALGWCTDTGYLTSQAKHMLTGCRILGIEANHDVTMLEHGPYPAMLKARVKGPRGHLSNDQCAEALPSLVTEDTETVVALHISEKNNRPSTCVRTLANALGAKPTNDVFTEAQTPDGMVSICVAAQDRPLSIW